MSKKGMGMGMGMGMGKGGDDEDTSTEDLQRLYRKNCAKSGITPLKAIEEKFNYIFDEGDGILEQVIIKFFLKLASYIYGMKSVQWESDAFAMR